MSAVLVHHDTKVSLNLQIQNSFLLCVSKMYLLVAKDIGYGCTIESLTRKRKFCFLNIRISLQISGRVTSNHSYILLPFNRWNGIIRSNLMLMNTFPYFIRPFIKCTPVKPLVIQIFSFANIHYNNLYNVNKILSHMLLLASKNIRDLFIIQSSTFNGWHPHMNFNWGF
jgi:hypothetical protein